MSSLLYASGSEPVLFQVGPLTIPIAADALQLWVERAAHADRLVFAYGPSPIRDHATFVLATRLKEEGRITIFQPRRAGTQIYDWIAERRGDGNGGERPGEDAGQPLDDIDLRVLAAIRNRIACGLSYEGDAGVAARCRLKDKRAARYRRDRLERAGAIAVRNRGPLKPLVVTDLASGRSTAE